MTNLIPRLDYFLQALVRRRSKCPNCGFELTERIARKSVVVSIRRCRSCLLCFTDPIYERDLLGRPADLGGAPTALPDHVRLAELARTCFHGADEDRHDRLRRLRELAPGPRLLEVGSAWGAFLFQAAAEGFDAVGVEASERRRAFGREALGVSIVASLQELGDQRFDLVYTSRSLSGFRDLSGLFPSLHERLVDGGLLAVEVEHFNLIERRRAVRSLGASHPLGFESAFFDRSLPPVGFQILGFYDTWEDVPTRPVTESHDDVVIVLARKRAASPLLAA